MARAGASAHLHVQRERLLYSTPPTPMGGGGPTGGGMPMGGAMTMKGVGAAIMGAGGGVGSFSILASTHLTNSRHRRNIGNVELNTQFERVWVRETLGRHFQKSIHSNRGLSVHRCQWIASRVRAM